ncbi:MAG: gliding motility-associated C-terminal domain-containing protein [Mucilaginibacter sp.]|nr:gliding motility-associated C-terminal domain-containing protein [Mucilaginibacter sp.]
MGGANVITVNSSPPTVNIHEIVPKGNKVDPYGGFSISPADGSGYAVKLGNDGTNAQAERISYLFNVPPNQADFIITYQYAVVLQDPGHIAAEQPRFTAKVFDITANSYISCGSFDYVATAALPGFKKSANFAKDKVIYKDWTPASINLYGYQGHQLRLEFTTADCTQNGHFGYAYVDVNNSCSQLIKGTDFCPSEPTFTLKGPAGFDQYRWYNADRSILLGTGINLTQPSANADGTTVFLDLIPFVGFGCNYTTSATVHALPGFIYTTKDPPAVCFPTTVDITSPVITAGSDANLTYTYWQDNAISTPIPQPKLITTSGTYYVAATAPSGCIDIRAVNVVINYLPTIVITNPPTVCLNTPVDITVPAVTAGSSPGAILTYWRDAQATQPLSTPTAVLTAGTYYIKATNATGCITVKPVNVMYNPLPVLVTNAPAAVCYPDTIDITAATVTSGSDANLTFTYWADAVASIPVATPNKITQSGVYYIKATNTNGCEKIAQVIVTINPLPQLLITPPTEMCAPVKIDITAANVTAGSTNIGTLTYWADKNTTIAVANPKAITDSGTYYIKATSPLGCEVIQSVLVNIHTTPLVVVKNPTKVYVPATVDITTKELVTGSTPNLTYTYWNNAAATDPILDPKAIIRTGTYYIKGNNTYCYDIKPVEVSVNIVAEVLVPKAFTPTGIDNKTLYPFLIGVKRLVTFKVFNRWGQLVFQTDSADPKNGWDGVYKGKIQFLDTYTWYAEGYDYTDKIVHKTGNTILLK